MAEILQQLGGVSVPRIICDHCQQPITDVHKGLVIFERPPEGDEATITRVFHTHKSLDCQAPVWAMAGESHCSGMSLELSAHLAMLSAMCGLFPARMQSVYRHLLSAGWVLPPLQGAEETGEDG